MKLQQIACATRVGIRQRSDPRGTGFDSSGRPRIASHCDRGRDRQGSRGPCTPRRRGGVPANVGQVVCFTKITGASGGETIHHVWFHGADQVGDVALAIAGSPWRTHSRKTIPVEATGAWHVEIRDGSGTLLQRVDFTVGE